MLGSRVIGRGGQKGEGTDRVCWAYPPKSSLEVFLQGKVVCINMQGLYPTRMYSFRYKLILQITLFHILFFILQAVYMSDADILFLIPQQPLSLSVFPGDYQIKSNFRSFGFKITLEVPSWSTLVACCLRSGFRVSNWNISTVWITASRSVHNHSICSSITLLNK